MRFPHREALSGWRFRLFAPILAGATLRERLVSCVGALACIALTGLICGGLLGEGPHLPLIVAPMGASAVLLFAVPSSPLAQPWPIIGGNTISAFMGVIAANLIHHPIIAIGVGVSLAIAAMSFTRCLHPPGGAAALTAVLGGAPVASWGLLFPFVPVGLNSCILVALGLLFHKLSRHNYPHVVVSATNTHHTKDQPANLRVGFREEDVDAALQVLKETFDIDRADLSRLLREVEIQATVRSNKDLKCADIMSRDVIAVSPDTTVEVAHALLIRHNVRTLPVKLPDGKLVGSVGLRELAFAAGPVEALMAPSATTSADAPALGLLPVLTDGKTHAVVVIDQAWQIIGLISQTDLLAAMARLAPTDRVARESVA
ncbi:HPP family protein [Rhizobium mongolense]|uniref:HPP family protein n=1 Tax=Rhizobium mongolense TaxID=57676 RepID=UPI0034A5713B